MSIRELMGDIRRAVRLAGRNDDRAQIERLIPLLRAPRKQPGEMKWRGRSVRYADGASLYGQLNEIYGQRCYDFESNKPDPRILDLGGNIGMATLRFRERHPHANITVFEPDPILLPFLQFNLSAAGDDITRVVPAAAWEFDGVIGFNSTGDDSGNIAPASPGKISCVDIADYCQDPVDFLKMDIEGAEYCVLQHLSRRNLLTNVQRLFIELHHWKEATEPPFFHEILSLLAREGFNYRIVSADIFRSSPTSDPLAGSGNLVTLRAGRG